VRLPAVGFGNHSTLEESVMLLDYSVLSIVCKYNEERAVHWSKESGQNERI